MGLAAQVQTCSSSVTVELDLPSEASKVSVGQAASRKCMCGSFGLCKGVLLLLAVSLILLGAGLFLGIHHQAQEIHKLLGIVERDYGLQPHKCCRPTCSDAGPCPAGEEANGFSLSSPDPSVLVWDEETIGRKVQWGWLNVPIINDKATLGLEESPRTCLRVHVRPAKQQPAANGPLMIHCGGPGSGMEQTCVDTQLRRDLFHPLEDTRLTDTYDIWSIGQRGTLDTESLVGVPDCPFQQSNITLKAFPYLYCNEFSSLTKDKLFANLGMPVDDELWNDVVEPILLQKDVPGLGFRNETKVRWYYKLLHLSNKLCYAAERYQFTSPLNGRKLNLLDFMGTVDLAFDIDSFRAAVGAETMSIWGISYGTFVGATYASIFGDRVHKLLLDGAMPPQFHTLDQGTQHAKGLNSVWNGLAAACEDAPSAFVNASEACPAAPGVTGKVLEMIERGDSRGLAVYGMILENMLSIQTEQPINVAAVLMACIQAEYSNTSVAGCPLHNTSFDWGGARQLVYNVPASVPSPHTDYFNLGINGAVLGLDVAGRPNEEEFIHWWEETLAAYPLSTSWAIGWVVAQATWPAIPAPVPPLGSTTVKPMIVGNLHDPRTAYDSAQRLKDVFPQGSLVTWQGYGHTTIGPRDSAAAVDAYTREVEAGEVPSYTLELAKLMCAQFIIVYMVGDQQPRDGHICRVPGPAPVNTPSALAYWKRPREAPWYWQDKYSR
eukprot:TRINITY_DN5956_c0_g1_i2.p1 TRINITY_DN5956_c0_g1~~TRINITY_DN5956_c0_g1_i2.p1  ORF type:complete len:719 (-),score=109.83 TRINITY_DN5956_c0_g1_i2:449-2605(-)